MICFQKGQHYTHDTNIGGPNTNTDEPVGGIFCSWSEEPLKIESRGALEGVENI